MTHAITIKSVLALAALGASLAPPAWAAEPVPLVYYGVAVEQLEHRFNDDGDLFAWDLEGFVGTDEWKLRLESEAEYSQNDDGFETLEHQLLIQRPISDFFDAKAGVRIDTPEGPNRSYAVLGVQGLAPHWFEVDADLFISENGDLSARLDVAYELLITNRLILTPSAEVDIAFSDDEDIGVGSGVSKTEAGLRLSYDLIERNVAPYAGIVYERSFGKTADLARAAGEDEEAFYIVAGVRLLF